MAQSLEELVGQRLMLAFRGKDELSPEIRKAIKEYRPAGITLFRSHNIDHPLQVKRLTTLLQEAARAAGLPPLLVAVDQEGGQLMAIGNGTTLLPGNMALGATGSTELARRAGEVLGHELAAMGVNINYAPCCDVNLNPQNPVIGVRSFGEEPEMVAEMASAMVTGIQSAGVAASSKHFPGHGDTSEDSHLGLPTIPHALDGLRKVEFPPFEAAIQAGTKLVMTAHIALPAIDGSDALPATLSPAILQGILRDQLKFQGVIITDAMDMRAITQGNALGVNAVRAAAAGADLILITTDPDDQHLVHSSLIQAVRQGIFPSENLESSARRISDLKRWLVNQKSTPELDVVGCEDHRKIADEIARRSVTLVRNQADLLPLRLRPEQKVAVMVPRPADLTPADTSSYVVPALAAAFRKFHSRVDEIIVSHSPSENEVASAMEKTRSYDLIVVGTLNAFNNSGQSALVRKVLEKGVPVLVVAMRLPYDLTAFPEAPSFVCTYSILEPSINALVSALFGQNKFQGRLPVSIPGLYPVGYHLEL